MLTKATCPECGYRHPVSEGITLYQNYYSCKECLLDWEDIWCCMCDDRCPKCDKEHEPFESRVIEVVEEPD